MPDIKIKICGLTNLEDARAALDAGADFLGFIFYPKSPRYVTPDQVRTIMGGLETKRRGVLTVGVFVNETTVEVARILDDCRLDLAQLHGDEIPEASELAENSEYAHLRSRSYKAFQPRTLEEAERLAQLYEVSSLVDGRDHKTPAFLIDAYHPKLHGGTGQIANWEIAARLANRYPFLLAGGLTPENVKRAIHAVRPWGIDISSGVELSPGKKDHRAIKSLFTIVKEIVEMRDING